jgi:hypothetical protein
MRINIERKNNHNEIREMPPFLLILRYVVLANWRGELPLAVSFWVIGFLVRLGFYAILSLVITYSTSYIALTAWILFFAFEVWMIVGIWRSANQLIRTRKRVGKRASWAVAAKAFIMLGIGMTVISIGNDRGFFGAKYHHAIAVIVGVADQRGHNQRDLVLIKLYHYPPSGQLYARRRTAYAGSGKVYLSHGSNSLNTSHRSGCRRRPHDPSPGLGDGGE